MGLGVNWAKGSMIRLWLSKLWKGRLIKLQFKIYKKSVTKEVVKPCCQNKPDIKNTGTQQDAVYVCIYWIVLCFWSYVIAISSEGSFAFVAIQKTQCNKPRVTTQLNFPPKSGESLPNSFVGPHAENCPRANSMKTTGKPTIINMMKHGRTKEPPPLT